MFTRMDSSTEEEWRHIAEEHKPHIQDMPKRVISMLQQLAGLSLGFGDRPTTSCSANSHHGQKGRC